jgi:uncharacterized Tic20 family protein
MNNNLNDNSTEVTSDEKLLAMLAHLSIFLGGIILPIILWATQKDKSKFVSFNSLQAIFYHLIYGLVVVMFVFVMVFIITVSGIGSGHHGHSVWRHGDTPVFIVFLCVIMILGICLVIFSGIGYAIYLAVISYQGRIIKIPVIGKIIYSHVYGDT